MGIQCLAGWLGGPEFDGWRDAQLGQSENNPHEEGSAAWQAYRRGYTNYQGPIPEDVRRLRPLGS